MFVCVEKSKKPLRLATEILLNLLVMLGVFLKIYGSSLVGFMKKQYRYCFKWWMHGHNIPDARLTVWMQPNSVAFGAGQSKIYRRRRWRWRSWHDSVFATAAAAKVAVPIRLPPFPSLSCHDSEGKGRGRDRGSPSRKCRDYRLKMPPWELTFLPTDSGCLSGSDRFSDGWLHNIGTIKSMPKIQPFFS